MGFPVGVYDAASEQEALDMMAYEAGYESFQEALEDGCLERRELVIQAGNSGLDFFSRTGYNNIMEKRNGEAR